MAKQRIRVKPHVRKRAGKTYRVGGHYRKPPKRSIRSRLPQYKVKELRVGVPGFEATLVPKKTRPARRKR